MVYFRNVSVNTLHKGDDDDDDNDGDNNNYVNMIKEETQNKNLKEIWEGLHINKKNKVSSLISDTLQIYIYIIRVQFLLFLGLSSDYELFLTVVVLHHLIHVIHIYKSFNSFASLKLLYLTLPQYVRKLLIWA